MNAPQSTENDLATAARVLAIMALQSERYGKEAEFRDAVDDVLLITRPVAEKACDDIVTALTVNRAQP